MSNSMLVAVREAVLAGAIELDPSDPDNGRPTSQSRSPSMSEPSGQPGAASNPGISQAALDAAVATARAEGAQAATDRLGAVLSAEGISGDGQRMAAAFQLAVQAPQMSAEAVTGFVTGNVAGASAHADASTVAALFEQSRAGATLAGAGAAGFAQPGEAQRARATINRSEIFAARRNNQGA